MDHKQNIDYKVDLEHKMREYQIETPDGELVTTTWRLIGILAVTMVLFSLLTVYLYYTGEGQDWKRLIVVAACFLGAAGAGYGFVVSFVGALLSNHYMEEESACWATWVVRVIYILLLVLIASFGYRLASYHFSLQSFQKHMSLYIEHGDKDHYQEALRKRQVTKWLWSKRLSHDHTWNHFWDAFEKAQRDGDLAMLKRLREDVKPIRGEGWDEAIARMKKQSRVETGRKGVSAEQPVIQESDTNQPEPDSEVKSAGEEPLPQSEPEPEPSPSPQPPSKIEDEPDDEDEDDVDDDDEEE